MQVHLQGMQRCLGCACLLLLTVVVERIIFLFEGSHVANARVCSQGALPCCDWELQASWCHASTITSVYIAAHTARCNSQEECKDSLGIREVRGLARSGLLDGMHVAHLRPPNSSGC